MKKIVIALLMMIITIFMGNIIVSADSYCNYNTKTACENHNKKEQAYNCEWKKTNNKEFCGVKCQGLSQTGCSGFSVCKWFSSDKKCHYFEESDNSNTSTPSVSKKCDKVTTKNECSNGSNCRWDSSGKKCRYSCASLNKNNCSNAYCKWENNKCNEVCSKITNSADCTLASCQWKNNKCSEKKSSGQNSSNSNSNNNTNSTSNSDPSQENDGSIEDATYDNYDDSLVSCGENLIEDIPESVPRIVHIIYLVIQIAVPVLLVIFGMLDLFKGLTAQKEDEIKKGQQMLVKRLISAAIIFFVFVIVKLFIGLAADANSQGRIVNCLECFINNSCD